MLRDATVGLVTVAASPMPAPSPMVLGVLVGVPVGMMITSGTCSNSTSAACASQPVVGQQRGDGTQRGDLGEPDDAPLGVIGDHHQPAGRLDQRAVGLGLQQVRRGQAGALVDAVHAHDHHVHVQ